MNTGITSSRKLTGRGCSAEEDSPQRHREHREKKHRERKEFERPFT
jgi:hypothetical protein